MSKESATTLAGLQSRNKQLKRRLQLVKQNARGLIDELIGRGFHYIEDENGNKTINADSIDELGDCITNFFILADTKTDIPETCFRTDKEAGK
tara:strand:+ start:136 stop:414 length:279 start_codon:yes stop_codon:yes gene_type:complete